MTHKLENQTSELMREMNEVFDVYTKKLLEEFDIEDLDTDTFDVLRKCLIFMKHAQELSVEQAKAIDSINNQLDRIEKILLKS